MKIFSSKTIFLIPLLAVGLALSGCGKDEYKMEGLQPQRTSIYYPLSNSSTPAVTAGDAAVFGHDGGPTSLSQAIGGSGSITGGSDHDYVTKADIYWKYNYLCKVINGGDTPRNFADELRKIEIETSGIQSDSNAALIMNIMENMKRGLDALKIEKKLRNIGLDSDSIPWGSGQFMIKQYLNQQAQNKTYNWLSSDTKQSIYDFEDNYHSPPSIIKQNSFQMASDETQELGGQLGLLKSKENSPFGSNYVH